MNQLPTDLENIIYKYKHQLQFIAVMNDIKNIEYEIDNGSIYKRSSRNYKNNEVQYYENYELDDYQEWVEYNYGDKFYHIELEIFSDINGWRKIDKEGKEVFYSSVW